MRLIGLVGASLLTTMAAACSHEAARPPSANPSASTTDAQHQGITTPHGDHSPHHGGMVLMNGELHYEVVFDRGGQHRVWFTDAVREDLPASIARDVRMTIARPNEAAEELTLDIDEAGESWIARGRAVHGDNVMVTVTYRAQGRPHEIEIPFLIPVK